MARFAVIDSAPAAALVDGAQFYGSGDTRGVGQPAPLQQVCVGNHRRLLDLRRRLMHQ